MWRYLLSGLATALILALPAAAGEPPPEPDPPGAVGEAALEAAKESALERRDRERLEKLAAAGLERQELAIDAGTLVYWRGGGGSPLVLLHGSGDSAGTFAEVAADLVADHTLLIPDLPGHGASEPSAGVLPMGTIFGGLEALLDEAELEKPVLVGNSMGAWLAMLYAHKYPERVARVVAVNGGAILGEPSDIKLMPASREEARASMAAIRDPSSPPVPDEVLDELVERSNSGPIARMMLDLAGMMGYLMDGKLGEISTPVELLWGESDQLMKLSYAEKMAAGLPRSRITRIPECGHIPMGECPERFVSLLRGLLIVEPPAAEPPAGEPATPESEEPESEEKGPPDDPR